MTVPKMYSTYGATLSVNSPASCLTQHKCLNGSHHMGPFEKKKGSCHSVLVTAVGEGSSPAPHSGIGRAIPGVAFLSSNHEGSKAKLVGHVNLYMASGKQRRDCHSQYRPMK